jgi:membrane-associated protease RseP (regulator of RpoE activity)
MRPPKINRLYEVMEINGVKVFAHWSVLLIGAVVALGAISEPATAIPGLVSYYGVILLHECGHMVFAQRKHCTVWSIELYPIWGITRFSEPYSRYDHCVIAWGGVIAQAIVAVPIVILSEMIGYTRFQPLNTILAMFGFFSLFVAAFNLIPAPPLDGAIAWGFVPALFRRYLRSRTVKREHGWRS